MKKILLFLAAAVIVFSIVSCDSLSPDDNYSNSGNGSNSGSNITEEVDFSDAEIKCNFSYLTMEILNCKRKGDEVIMTILVTSDEDCNLRFSCHETSAPFISDNLGNPYSRKNVKYTMGGESLGWCNSEDVDLYEDMPTRCEIAVRGVDSGARYMSYVIQAWSTIPGNVSTREELKFRNVKIH